MRLAARFIAVALVVAGCEPDETRDPTPEVPFAHYASGTRLRARVLDGGDGAVKLVGWRDTGLDVDCEMRATNAGVRCVPLESRDNYFADPECTEPIHFGAVPDSGLALTAVDGLCGAESEWHVWRIDETELGPDTVYGRSDAGDCVADETVDPSVPRYRLVDATAELVPMTTTTTALGALEVVFAVGDDGSRAVISLVDHATGVRCVEAGGPTIANGVDVCVPFDSTYVADGYYASPDCSGESRGAFTCDATPCPTPGLGVFTQTTDCESEVTLLSLGAQQSSYGLANGVCEEVVFGPCVFFPATATLDPRSFPALQHLPIGEGRLQVDTLTPEGSEDILAFGGFIDTNAGAPCVPVDIDGATRCVPSPVSVNPGFTWYSDPSCSKPVAPTSSVDPCAAAPTVALHYDQPDGLIITEAPVDAAYSVTTRTTTATYAFVGDACVMQGPQDVLLLAPLDPSTLAPLSTRIE
ncbi:MAG: hypothetical protein U0271_28725 [Polyangiaceae bacterium]